MRFINFIMIVIVLMVVIFRTANDMSKNSFERLLDYHGKNVVISQLGSVQLIEINKNGYCVIKEGAGGKKYSVFYTELILPH